jgi:hypothetical protein
MPKDGFLRGVHYLILDRDPLYTVVFRDRLQDSGMTPLRLPAPSPNLNAFAERFVGSVKSECLAQMVPLGEGHLRIAVRAFVDHYHEERPHQGLGNECGRVHDTVTVGRTSSIASSFDRYGILHDGGRRHAVAGRWHGVVNWS